MEKKINNELFLKTQKITSVHEDMEKLEPFWLLVEISNGIGTLGNSIAVPKKWMWFTIPLERIERIENRVSKDICTAMFVTALLTLGNDGSNPSTHHWMNG